MSFGEAVKSVFSKYATFSGRARRSEYWYFMLLNLLMSVLLGTIPVLWTLWMIAAFVPGVAVFVRRLHDVGKSGRSYLGLYLLAIVLCCIGVLCCDGAGALGVLMILVGVAIFIYILILPLKDSQPGTNKYGPNPKEHAGEDKQPKEPVQPVIEKPVVFESSNTVPQLTECPNCGAPVAPGTNCCVYCGSKL